VCSSRLRDVRLAPQGDDREPTLAERLGDGSRSPAVLLLEPGDRLLATRREREARDRAVVLPCRVCGLQLVTAADADAEGARNVLPEKAMGVRTDVRTGLSPLPASCCSSLESRFPPHAARFRLMQLVAACQAGLLIPRSQVRSLPRPSRKCLENHAPSLHRVRSSPRVGREGQPRRQPNAQGACVNQQE
jgi:hypothetical protein